jgi:hypothetical protein
MYIVLVFGGYGLFVVDAYPRIPNLYMASYHKCVLQGLAAHAEALMVSWSSAIRLPPTHTLPAHPPRCHRWNGVALMAACLFTFVKASTVSPGVITKGGWNRSSCVALQSRQLTAGWRLPRAPVRPCSFHVPRKCGLLSSLRT